MPENRDLLVLASVRAWIQISEGRKKNHLILDFQCSQYIRRGKPMIGCGTHRDQKWQKEPRKAFYRNQLNATPNSKGLPQINRHGEKQGTVERRL